MRKTSLSRCNEIYLVPSVVKAVDIIGYIAEKGAAPLTEICTELGLPKSSTYQIITTLISKGLIRRVVDSLHYSLGLRLIELGVKAVGSIDIRIEALPLLRKLMEKTHQTSHLAIRDGAEGVYLVKVESNRPLRIYSWEGKRLPLHSSAMGKVLLAWLGDNQLEDLLKKMTLIAYTDNTITDVKVLKRHLRLVRKRGWSLDDQENEPNIRCIGAPVFNIDGEIVGAISVSGLAAELVEDRLTEICYSVMQTASELSKKMGNLKN